MKSLLVLKKNWAKTYLFYVKKGSISFQILYLISIDNTNKLKKTKKNWASQKICLYGMHIAK